MGFVGVSERTGPFDGCVSWLFADGAFLTSFFDEVGKLGAIIMLENTDMDNTLGL